MTYPHNAWVRVYFSGRCEFWVVDNNMSESLNAWIDEYLYLMVIRMFDGIRLKMMGKWADSEINVRHWKSDYSPKFIDLFEANRFLAENCIVFFNGDEGYEVVEGQNRHYVHLSRAICTCRAWHITEIPCQYAICAMYHAKIEPKSQISHYYHKDTYLASYRTKLQPVRGKQFWDTETFLPMQPPHVSNLPGRPPKKRVRIEEAERTRKKSVHNAQGTAQPQPQMERLTRRGKRHKCTVCNQEGHNKSTCKETPSASRPRNQKINKLASSQQPPLNSQSFQEPPQPSQLTQESRNLSQSSHIALNPTPSSKQTAAAKKFSYMSRVEYGMGIRFDETTGRTVYNRWCLKRGQHKNICIVMQIHRQNSPYLMKWN